MQDVAPSWHVVFGEHDSKSISYHTTNIGKYWQLQRNMLIYPLFSIIQTNTYLLTESSYVLLKFRFTLLLAVWDYKYQIVRAVWVLCYWSWKLLWWFDWQAAIMFLCHDTFNKGLLLLHLTAKIKVAQSEWRPLFIIKACQIVDNLVS